MGLGNTILGVLWVVGAENLCHQVIFINHATGAVAPPDAEVVQVGDAPRQKAKEHGLHSA